MTAADDDGLSVCSCDVANGRVMPQRRLRLRRPAREVGRSGELYDVIDDAVASLAERLPGFDECAR
jgi:hypothetical protein